MDGILQGGWFEEMDDDYGDSHHTDFSDDEYSLDVDVGDFGFAEAAAVGGMVGGMMSEFDGENLSGTAAEATMSEEPSFNKKPRPGSFNGPDLGVAWKNRKDPGFRVVVNGQRERLLAVKEAAERALREIDALEQQGLVPHKFAEGLVFDIKPNPKWEKGSKQPIGFVSLGARGAMKSETGDGQMPTSRVGSDMEAALDIIEDNNFLDIGPRRQPRTSATARSRIETPETRGERTVSLFELE